MKRQFGLDALKSAFFVLTLFLLLPGQSSYAIDAKQDIKQKQVELKADPKKVPYEMQDVAVKEHLGEKIDLNLQFTDSADGQKHALKDYFQNGKPTILNLVYYECPMLCTMVLNGLSAGLKGLDWSIGDQFNVLTISIDPKDDIGDAEQKRNVYVKDYLTTAQGSVVSRNEATTKSGWHFFTADETSVKTLADQLGFGYQYDKFQKQYAHAAVTFVLTPEGSISRYLYGIQYRPRDVRLALLEASRGKVGNVFDRLLMFCYHYEPGTRGYAVKAVQVMKLGGAATVALLGGWLSFFWFSQSRQQRRKKNLLVERKDPVS